MTEDRRAKLVAMASASSSSAADVRGTVPASFEISGEVVDFGVDQALLTNVAQNVARGDIAEIRRQIGATLLVSLVLAFVRTLLAITIIPRVTSPREDCGRS